MRALVTVNKSGTAQRVRGRDTKREREAMYAAYQRQARPGIASTGCYQTLLCLLFAPSFPPLCTVSAVVVLVISTICWLDFQLFFLVVLFRSPSLACSLCKKVTFGLNFLRACPPAFSVLIKILSDLILFLSALICDCKRVFSASIILQYNFLSWSHFFYSYSILYNHF